MKKFLLFALSASLLAVSTPVVHSADVRSSWDYNKLSDVTDPNKMRAIFGFFPNRSVNDDYSFTVTIQDAKPYQLFSVLLSPCTSFKKVDMNFDACIESVAYRKKGDTKWSDSALSKISLGEPTTTIKKGGDLVVGEPVTSDPNTLRPPGDRATIWEMPGAKHAKGSSYLVRATIRHPGADNISYIDGGLQRLFTMEILPISFTASGVTIMNTNSNCVWEFSLNPYPDGSWVGSKTHLSIEMDLRVI